MQGPRRPEAPGSTGRRGAHTAERDLVQALTLPLVSPPRSHPARTAQNQGASAAREGPQASSGQSGGSPGAGPPPSGPQASLATFCAPGGPCSLGQGRSLAGRLLGKAEGRKTGTTYRISFPVTLNRRSLQCAVGGGGTLPFGEAAGSVTGASARKRPVGQESSSAFP